VTRTHSLKVWPEPFKALLDGTKRFEFRKDDRGYAVGDVLELHEWDPTPSVHLSEPVGYTGHRIYRRVTYLARGQWGIPDGYVVMSLTKVEES
jgi:hypothetical protein